MPWSLQPLGGEGLGGPRSEPSHDTVLKTAWRRGASAALTPGPLWATQAGSPTQGQLGLGAACGQLSLHRLGCLLHGAEAQQGLATNGGLGVPGGRGPGGPSLEPLCVLCGMAGLEGRSGGQPGPWGEQERPEVMGSRFGGRGWRVRVRKGLVQCREHSTLWAPEGHGRRGGAPWLREAWQSHWGGHLSGGHEPQDHSWGWGWSQDWSCGAWRGCGSWAPPTGLGGSEERDFLPPCLTAGCVCVCPGTLPPSCPSGPPTWTLRFSVRLGKRCSATCPGPMRPALSS